MKHLKRFSLFESVKSQDMLGKLARNILKYIAYNTTYEKNFGLSLSNWKLEYDSFDLETIDKDFYKSLDLYFNEVLFEIDESGRIGGRYHAGNIKLFYKRGFFDDIREYIKESDFVINDTIKYILENKLLINFQDVLVHELQHVYDSYVSNFEYTNSKEFNRFQRYRNQGIKPLITYEELPHEINANFTSAVNKLNFIDIEKTREIRKTTKKSFQEINNEFKNIMRSYDLFSDKIKKNLTKRLYNIWLEKFK